MSRRAATLLDLATKHGHDVAASEHVAGCWTIRAPGGLPGDPSLTVYSGENDSGEVYYDGSGSRTWEQITQTFARTILVHRTLGPERLWAEAGYEQTA